MPNRQDAATEKSLTEHYKPMMHYKKPLAEHGKSLAGTCKRETHRCK